MPRKYASMADRIKANTTPSVITYQGTPCWVWTGALTAGGRYGKISLRWKAGPRKGQVRSALAHRIALITFKPHLRLTHKMVAKHLCNNSLCCNPTHLSGGTQKSNVRQCVREGRHKNAYGLTGDLSAGARL